MSACSLASDLGDLVKASGENSIQWSKKSNANLTINDLFATCTE